MINKRKIIKTTLITTATVGLTGLIVGLAVDWKFPSWIYVSGSSTVQPLIAKISNIYTTAEVISEAGGSSTGIANVVNKTKNIGATSRMPNVSEAGLPDDSNALYAKQWSDLAIKTLTIGFDGIGLVYKCADLKDDLIINQDNIYDIYKCFSGIDNQEIYINQLIKNTNVSKKIKPYARSGGSNTSGTAEAFLKDSNLDVSKSVNYNQKEWDKINSLLQTGNYGSNVVQTNESNIMTWSLIKLNSTENKFAYMTYLSSGFIKNNYDEIINSGFKIAKYQSPNNDNPIDLIDPETKQINIPNQYKWYRPLELLIRLSDPEKELSVIKKFIEWLEQESLDDSSKLSKIYDELGYIRLDASLWNTMKINNNLWVSDYQLLNNPTQKSLRYKTKKYYGAIYGE